MFDGLPMSDVKVGMRLRSIFGDNPTCSPITVTELTDRGFRYRLDRDVPLIPRWGMTILAEGHEHYGINGRALYVAEVYA